MRGFHIIDSIPVNENDLQNFDFILDCAALSPFKIAFLNAAQKHQIIIAGRTLKKLYYPSIEATLEQLLRSSGTPSITSINPVVDERVIIQAESIPDSPRSLTFASLELANTSVQIVTESNGLANARSVQTNYIFYLSDGMIQIVLNKNFHYLPSSAEDIAREVVDGWRFYHLSNGLAFYWQSMIRTLLAKRFGEQFDEARYRFQIELESSVSALVRSRYGQGKTGLVFFQDGKASVYFRE